MKKSVLFLMVMLLTLGLFAAAAEEVGGTEESAAIVVAGETAGEVVTVESEATVQTSGEYEYILQEDGTARIVRYTGMAAEVVVPEKLDEHDVTAIGEDAFMKCTFMIRVVLPAGVVKVPTNPFADCIRLMDIQVAEENAVLKVVEGVLFDDAEKRLICFPCALGTETYAVPEDTVVIGDYAFLDCDKLQNVSLPETVTAIGNGAFKGCLALTGMELPEDVAGIGNEAFAFCEALQTVTLSKNLTSIGDGAFFGCISLKKAELPEGLAYIGNQAFASCIGLTGIVIPDSVAQLMGNPFSGCTNLKDIQLSWGHPVLTCIDGVLYVKAEKKLVCVSAGYDKEEYTIFDGVCAIENYAFSNSSALKKVKIPSSVVNVGEQAFVGCPKGMVAVVENGSEIAKLFETNGIAMEFYPDMSWLND